MELPLQFIKVKKTNYTIKRYRVEDGYRWSLENYKTKIEGFTSAAAAKNLLVTAHPFCIYCQTFLSGYTKDECMDYINNFLMTTDMACPYCKSWNDELLLTEGQEVGPDDHRKHQNPNKRQRLHDFKHQYCF